MPSLSIAQRLERLRVPADKTSEAYWRYGKLNETMLLYQQKSCNVGIVEVFAHPPDWEDYGFRKYRVELKGILGWIVKVVEPSTTPVARNIWIFNGGTPEEALEKAEFELGLEKLANVGLFLGP